MAAHTPFFDLVSRDLTALLGIAEYLELLGRNRVASMVRSVTFSIENTVGDLRHDLVHTNKKGRRQRSSARRDREHTRRRLSRRQTRDPTSPNSARRHPAS